MQYLSNIFNVCYAGTVDINNGDTVASMYKGRLYCNITTGSKWVSNAGDGSDWVQLITGQDPNKTPMPDISLPTSGVKGDTIDVVINNYDAGFTYTVNVSAGSIDTGSHPFKWTLPNTVGTETIEITAEDTTNSKDVSDVASKTISVEAASKTETPDYTLDASKNEGSIEYITINNYDSSFTYNATVSGGNVQITSNPFKWTLPSVTSDETHTISITAEDVPGGLSVSDANSQSLTVLNVPQVDDQTLVYNSGNIDDEFVYRYNTRTSNDYIEIDSPAYNINVQDTSNGSTTTKVYLNNKLVSVDVGDTLVADGTEEFVVQVVDHDEVIQEVKAVAISGGNKHSLIISSNGHVYSTGKNNYGQLGLGDTTDRSVFTDTGVVATAVSGGDNHSLIISSNGNVWSTGINGDGELGLGDTTDRSVFTDTGVIATDISAGYQHSLIISSNGNVWSTGYNGNGQLGLGDTTDRSSFTDTGVQATAVESNGRNTIIIGSNGNVWGTGDNQNGILGLGDSTTRSSFTDTGVVASAINISNSHSLIIGTNGNVWSTGSNNKGQLGLGDTTSRSSFTDTGVQATAIACGGDSNTHSLIISSNGNVWSTGSNGYGQLGFGDTIDRSSFTDTGITGIGIACDGYSSYGQSFIIDPNGNVYSTGRNDKSQLGLGDTTDRSYFTDTGNRGHKIDYYKNYWITPESDLSQVPSAVYPVPKVKLNNVSLAGDTISYTSPSLQVNYLDITLPASSSIITTQVTVYDGLHFNNFSADLKTS